MHTAWTEVELEERRNGLEIWLRRVVQDPLYVQEGECMSSIMEFLTDDAPDSDSEPPNETEKSLVPLVSQLHAGSKFKSLGRGVQEIAKGAGRDWGQSFKQGSKTLQYKLQQSQLGWRSGTTQPLLEEMPSEFRGAERPVHHGTAASVSMPQPRGDRGLTNL